MCLFVLGTELCFLSHLMLWGEGVPAPAHVEDMFSGGKTQGEHEMPRPSLFRVGLLGRVSYSGGVPAQCSVCCSFGKRSLSALLQLLWMEDTALITEKSILFAVAAV